MKPEDLELLAEAMGKVGVFITTTSLEFPISEVWCDSENDGLSRFEPHKDPAQFVEVLEWMCEEESVDSIRSWQSMETGDFEFEVLTLGLYGEHEWDFSVGADSVMEAATLAAIELSKHIEAGGGE